MPLEVFKFRQRRRLPKSDLTRSFKLSSTPILRLKHALRLKTPYTMSSSQLYHRRSFLVGSSSHQDVEPATTSTSDMTARDPMTKAEILIIIFLAFFVLPTILGSISCAMHYFPLLFFQHHSPYSALTPSTPPHVQLTMLGSLITALPIYFLWYAVEKILGKSWIVRSLLVAILRTFPLAAGVAAVPSAAPAGFHVEHGVTIGLWSLVPELTFLVAFGALMKRCGLLPRFS